jgi:hypothetical protein
VAGIAVALHTCVDTSERTDSQPAEGGGDGLGPRGGAVRRRRQLIETAVVASEITATVIGDSRGLIDYARKVVARPHIIVTALSESPPPREPIICERCRRLIHTPGIAIIRGRTITHVRCDSPVTTTG